jgi:hypothetical protein
MNKSIRSILCHMLIAAWALTTFQCANDDDGSSPDAPAPLKCQPTVLAGPEGLLYISYNADSMVKQVTSPAYDNAPEYVQEYLYTDGNRTRANFYADGKIIGYHVIQYSASRITEAVYEYMDDVEYKSRDYIHYLKDGRIVATANYDTPSNTRYDSTYFTYTDGNITRADSYGNDRELLYYSLYQYDSKINPHALIDVSGYQGIGFLPVSRSKNNIIRIEYHYETDSNITEYSYTYNANDLPLTFTLDDYSLDFEYACL